MSSNQMSLQAWLLLIFLSLLWGGSFLFNALILRELPPLTLVLGRVTLAAIGLHIIIIGTGQRMPSQWEAWFGFAVMGLLNNMIPFSLIVWGQVYLESGVAAILNATTPLFSVLFAAFFSIEALSWNRMGGVIVGFIGVVVLVGGATLGFGGWDVLAQLAVLGAAVSYAIAAIWGRRFKEMPALFPATGMLTCSAIFMLPLVLWVDPPLSFNLQPVTWLSLIGLALLSTSLAYIVYFRLLSLAGPTNLLLVTLLIPLSALLFGALILGERPDRSAYIGMMLILCGLLLVDGRVLLGKE